MGFYCDLLSKVICDPWHMFFTLFAPEVVSWQVVSELVIFSSHKFNHKVVTVCADHDVQNFVRDVIQELVVVY